MKILRNLVIVVAVFALLALAGFFVFVVLEQYARISELQRQRNVAAVFVTQSVELPHLVPMDGEEVSAATIDFEFMGEAHSIQPQVNYRVYHGAVALDRSRLWDSLWQEAGFDDSQLFAAYYNFLTLEPQMNHAIESVLVQLRDIRDERNLTNDEYIELIVRYVQSIPYCYVHGNLDNPLWMLGCPRMPIQVLVDGRGDCDETAMLLAILLYREGYAVSLLNFEEEQHMALGLSVEGDGFENTGYVFVETTSLIYISEVPEMLEGDIVLESVPDVLVIGSRPVENQQPYFSAEALAEIARIIDVRERAEAAADEKFRFIERTPMSLAEFNRQVALYENTFVAMNEFRSTSYEEGGSCDGIFMDRVCAIRWIEKHAWWE